MIAGISGITGIGHQCLSLSLQKFIPRESHREHWQSAGDGGSGQVWGQRGSRLWDESVGWQELSAQPQLACLLGALPMPHVLLLWIPRRETARKSLALGRRGIPVGSKREFPRPVTCAGCKQGWCRTFVFLAIQGAVWAAWIWASGLPTRARGSTAHPWQFLGVRVSWVTSLLFSDKKSPSLPRKWFTGICYFITRVVLYSQTSENKKQAHSGTFKCTHTHTHTHTQVSSSPHSLDFLTRWDLITISSEENQNV